MTPMHKTAIIDVGSNSCRLVIYECQGHSILPYFNEKTMAGLGRGLSQTGRLSVPGQRLALETMRRFRAILNGLGIQQAYAVATAAVRDAEDGAVFCQQAEAALGIPLRILSGVEEGRLSAAGVAYGFGNDAGWVADLGGRSLEIQALRASAPSGQTCPLGPLACEMQRQGSLADQRAHIHKTLSGLRMPEPESPLYLVGGGWRNLAQLHMMLTDYPLRVVQAYVLDREAVKFTLRQLQRAEDKPKLKSALQSVSKKRYNTMVHVALVLDCLLEHSACSAATVSAYGLREGVIIDTQALNMQMALNDAVRHQLYLSSQACAFGQQVYTFATPVLAALDQDAWVLRATCLMAEAGARLHPDHRAELVFQQILRMPLPWLTHQQRIFAAYAIATRTSYRFDMPSILRSACEPKLVKQARILGTVLRLASVYAGRSAHLLKTAALQIDKRRLILKIQQSSVDLVSETVHRRLTQMAGLLDREAAILYVDASDIDGAGTTTGVSDSTIVQTA